MNKYREQIAQEEFNKVYFKEKFKRILSVLNPQEDDLLSFYDVKNLIKPKDQSYLGMMTVPVKRIVGSEDRYQDFDNAFLPRRQFLKSRWTAINRAHQSDVVLPPIQLYRLGGVYFVRDGNHRVSVARAMGAEFIDAEVTELSSSIKLEPGFTLEQLTQAVVSYERKSFISATRFDRVVDMSQIIFTFPGRYDEMLQHVMGHKYFINQKSKEEISLEDAAQSWFLYVYLPISSLIEEEGLERSFPEHTKADLYMWVVQSWHDLKQQYGKVKANAAIKAVKKRRGKFVGRILGQTEKNPAK